MLPTGEKHGIHPAPRELLERCDPIRRQFLGDCTSAMGFQLPELEEIPLRAWLEEHTDQVMSLQEERPRTFAVTTAGE